MASQEPQIGQRRMAGVQYMQLEAFMGLDVADNLGASLLPGWTRPLEPVLDHPLCERLAADAGFVNQPQRVRNPIPARLRRRGDNAVEHGIGKCGVLDDPAREPALRMSVELGGEGRTAASSVRPLPARLSQLSTVTGPLPLLRRSARPWTSQPMVERG